MWPPRTICFLWESGGWEVDEEEKKSGRSLARSCASLPASSPLSVSHHRHAHHHERRPPDRGAVSFLVLRAWRRERCERHRRPAASSDRLCALSPLLVRGASSLLAPAPWAGQAVRRAGGCACLCPWLGTRPPRACAFFQFEAAPAGPHPSNPLPHHHSQAVLRLPRRLQACLVSPGRGPAQCSVAAKMPSPARRA